jgi:hypothetical protein
MFALLVLALALMSPGAPQDLNPAQIEKIEKEFAFYPGGRLDISAALPGNIRIIGWPQATIRVEAEKIVRATDQDQAPELFKQIAVRITNTPTTARISIAAQPPGFYPEVRLVIYVPIQKTDMTIKMIQGDLSIASVRGSIEATLEAGNIEATDLAGYFSGLTKAGDLSVDLAGKRWAGYGLSAASRCGSVRLLVPADYSAVLQLETKEGRISVDFPDQLVDGEAVPLQAVARKKAQSLNAPIGSGGIPVRLATLSGNISVQKK